MRMSSFFGSVVCTVVGWLAWGSLSAAGQEVTNAPAASADRVARRIPIEDLLKDDTLWQRTVDSFADTYSGLSLHWVTEKTKAQGNHPGLCLDRFRVWDLLVDFESDKPVRFTFSLYNRGDAGDISRDDYGAILNGIGQWLVNWAGKPSPQESVRGASHTTLYRQRWIRKPHAVTMDWSYSEIREGRGVAFRGEFIRLTLSEARADSSVAAPALVSARPAGSALTAIQLRTRISRDPASGDVCIKDVPMVDQGKKGYCAAAVAERVMRYFGADFDQHQAAQIAGTSREGGTTSADMILTLRRIASAQKLNFQTYEEFDEREFEDLISDYNREAKRTGRKGINVEDYAENGVVDLNAILAALEPAVLKAARLSQRQGRARFEQRVTERIDAGVPLVWGVQLGLYRETPALTEQTEGGHVRLIIGYNRAHKEVLYTDTWGNGHELKRLPMDEAWSMTFGLFALLPRNLQ